MNKHCTDSKKNCVTVVNITVNSPEGLSVHPRPVFVTKPHKLDSRERLEVGHTYGAEARSDGWFIFHGMHGKGVSAEKLKRDWHDELVEVTDNKGKDYFKV